jgi:ribosomal-protein-alanine N-acetyltransferase
VRLAQPSDLADIFYIEETQFPEPWTKSMLRDELENTQSRRYSVVEHEGQIVGYLGLMYVLRDEMHINTIGTRPGFEGRGIARALLDDGWADARLRGVERVTLEVAVSNTRAQRLYFHYGFAPVGIRKNYYEKTKEDALILWADLGPTTAPNS